MIELRSDTFTKPSPAMLEAMMAAPVGDDVFGEDPTVNRLETMVAELFGMEAALFCPSGTMTNQIAIKAHTQPGDEVICDELSHVYQYEGGGIAFNSGCATKLIHGNRGRITGAQVEAAINPDDIHKPPSRLVVLENTSNRGGGACYAFEDIENIKSVCTRHGLSLHLDGARIWNAMVAKNESPAQYGRIFDSISVCLSKGMGTPVGSVLIGTHAFIQKSRRIRKILGGGMRQAGYLAAAGIHAIQHHLPKLALDHQHAAMVAEVLARKSWVSEVLPPETNILIFKTTDTMPAAALVKKLAENDIHCLAIGPDAIRFVFHLDVSAAQTALLCSVLEKW
ncbi:MAG TPA: GntG family PLP-dependent aldolase [Phnomibacter sp.]|nr:GntG family PLP-dependent aldolase [Phnomibacter sp.]